MSTRSRIGMVMPDGKVKSIYCHWDGYPEGVGKTLENSYTDPKEVEKLLELGDISSLGTHYDEEVSEADWKKFDIKDKKMRDLFIQKSADCTVAYKDRGEDSPARIDEDEEDFIGKAGKCCEEYMYLFKEDYSGVWRWHIMETPWFRPLSDVLTGED